MSRRFGKRARARVCEREREREREREGEGEGDEISRQGNGRLLRAASRMLIRLKNRVSRSSRSFARGFLFFIISALLPIRFWHLRDWVRAL